VQALPAAFVCPTLWQARCVHRGVRIGLWALAAVTLVAGCSSSTSSSLSPTAVRCEIAATLSAVSFAPEGGNGTVAVTAERDCTWSIAADAAWVVVQGPLQGQGGTSVPYRVTPNATPNARRATVSVNANRLEVAQAGAPCRFQLDRLQVDLGDGGGSAAVRVTALTGCRWTAGSREAWISLTATSGNGPGVVTLGAGPNLGSRRHGTVIVAGQTVAVTQSGATASSPVPPAPTPPSPSPPADPATHLVGRLSNRGGACPNVGFVLGGHSVETDTSTQYRRGNCRNLTNGAAVEVRGRRTAAGRIWAEQITIVQRSGDDDDDDDDD
jgi:hypothetical protein